MSNVYRITPLEDESIYAHYELSRVNKDGSISYVVIDDAYREGHGYILEDMDCDLPHDDDLTVFCDPSTKPEPFLMGPINCIFEFSDDLSPLECQQIEDAFLDGGIESLREVDDTWQQEDSVIVILGPFNVDLCDSSGAVIEQSVALPIRVDSESDQQLFETETEDMNTPKKMTVVFAPGCFDNFEGTQEELDEMIADIHRMVETGELFEKAEPLDIDSLTDEELREYAEDIGRADKRKLQ